MNMLETIMMRPRNMRRIVYIAEGWILLNNVSDSVVCLQAAKVGWYEREIGKYKEKLGHLEFYKGRVEVKTVKHLC